MSDRVREEAFSLSPKAARVQSEETFGARLRGWIAKADVSFTAAADAVGIRRTELYECMDGERTYKAAWLRLLPVAVQRVICAEWADSLGYELRLAPILDESHDDDRAATALIHEALDAIRAVTTTQADKSIERMEAVDERKELLELQDAISLRVARLNQVIDGPRLVGGKGR